MKKIEYIKPELEVLHPKEALLETIPKDSNIYDEDPLLGKEAFFEDDTNESIFKPHKNLWDD